MLPEFDRQLWKAYRISSRSAILALAQTAAILWGLRGPCTPWRCGSYGWHSLRPTGPAGCQPRIIPVQVGSILEAVVVPVLQWLTGPGALASHVVALFTGRRPERYAPARAQMSGCPAPRWSQAA
jgi:hypothetical protein